jgi:hypothetical protein
LQVGIACSFKRRAMAPMLSLCVPKTLSGLLTLWNRPNDRVVLFRSDRPGLTVQVEVAA